MVLRALVLFSRPKRVPLIKFRKGGYTASAANQASPNTASQIPASPNTASPSQAPVVSSNALEDFELPSRYSRKPIDPIEMEYINRGGPA